MSPRTETHPLVALVRRFCCDYLSPPDLSVLPEIFHPSYQLNIGGSTISGRDSYLAVAKPLFADNPDFGITVHELFTHGSSIAMRFSSHAMSLKHRGHKAVWGGVIIFESDGEKLTRAWLEEDFFGRAQQLRSGIPDPMEQAHPNPWAIAVSSQDAVAEATVRDWVHSGGLAGVDVVDSRGVGPPRDRPDVDVDQVTIDAMCAVEGSVAFHSTQAGCYRGGLNGYEPAIGHRVERHVAGIATVRAGRVSEARCFSDRFELARRLRDIR